MAKRNPNLIRPSLLVRPIIQRLEAYVPGEQPQVRGLIKLNTNENPYGPSPEVLDALKSAIGGQLRLYPSPTAEKLRARLAQIHECSPENIIVGNGSDELLALATRAFVEPLTGLTQFALQRAINGDRRSPRAGRALPPRAELQGVSRPSRYTVQFLHPSYSLYPVLAAMHGAWAKAAPLAQDFTLPTPAALQQNGWDFAAALSYITTPHAPSGRGMARTQLDAFCRVHRGVLVLDEAYVDFADEDALALALKHPHVIVSRTFSKAYSLCSLRVGYFVGHRDLIGALHKIRDSYNVNGLGQVAAEATLDSLPYYRKNFVRIIESREYLTQALSSLEFRVFPSQTNFILVRPPQFPAETWLQRLRERRIFVRWFSVPEVRDFLRISIGSESEVESLVKAVKGILSKN